MVLRDPELVGVVERFCKCTVDRDSTERAARVSGPVPANEYQVEIDAVAVAIEVYVSKSGRVAELDPPYVTCCLRRVDHERKRPLISSPWTPNEEEP